MKGRARESAPYRSRGTCRIKTEKSRPRSNELITEDHAALEFARLYEGRLRYCHDTGSWFEWDGFLWRQNRTGIAFQWARALVRDLASREDDRIRYISSKRALRLASKGSLSPILLSP